MKLDNIRIVIYLLVLIALFIYFFHSTIAIRLLNLPECILKYISMPSKIVFIYGIPCTQCPSGELLTSLINQSSEYEIIFVISSKYTQNDISNLKRAFSLKGIFVESNESTENFKEKILKLTKSNEKGVGFCLTVNNSKKIKKAYLF
jgi:hypothetical protein